MGVGGRRERGKFIEADTMKWWETNEWSSLVAQMVKNVLPVQEIWV